MMSILQALEIDNFDNQVNINVLRVDLDSEKVKFFMQKYRTINRDRIIYLIKL